MKIFYVIFLLCFGFFESLNAKVTDINNINNAKKVIQIGMFAEKQYLDDCIKKLNDKYDLFFKSYQDLQIIYAVNILENDLNTSIDDIQNYYSDAFINEKVYFSKKSQPSTMSTVFNKDRVNIIQVGMFEKRENINNSIKEFSDYTIMIKPYKNTHIVYVMDVKMNMIDKMLNNVQTKYSDAFINKKIHLYNKPQKVERKVIIQIQEEKPLEDVNVEVKKVVYEPVNLDKLITSFENLPSAIYGRI